MEKMREKGKKSETSVSNESMSASSFSVTRAHFAILEQSIFGGRAQTHALKKNDFLKTLFKKLVFLMKDPFPFAFHAGISFCTRVDRSTDCIASVLMPCAPSLPSPEHGEQERRFFEFFQKKSVIFYSSS